MHSASNECRQVHPLPLTARTLTMALCVRRVPRGRSVARGARCICRLVTRADNASTTRMGRVTSIAQPLEKHRERY